MLRTLLALVIAAAPIAAAAAPSPVPGVPAPGARSRDGGVIAGRITGIDFQRSNVNVDSPARGHVEVAVMPSTSIQSSAPGYHSITDLRVGDRVEIYSSVSDGRFVAQIIRIR